MLETRTYGLEGPRVVVLHGGPGAPGHMAPVARGLAECFRVVEPMQRRSGALPLPVAQHVADLHELLEASPGPSPAALVGSSWGAMLALAYAAAHPEAGSPLVLVGCGTFETASRAQMLETLEAGMQGGLRDELARIEREIEDPDERLAARGAAIDRLYVVDPLPAEQGDDLALDAQGHRETWEDMLQQQASGVYPAAFARIRSPVLMLHGSEDPHPGRLIRESLRPHLPQLEYVEWERCGHYPWRERHIRDAFFAVLAAWLALRSETSR